MYFLSAALWIHDCTTSPWPCDWNKVFNHTIRDRMRLIQSSTQLLWGEEFASIQDMSSSNFPRYEWPPTQVRRDRRQKDTHELGSSVVSARTNSNNIMHDWFEGSTRLRYRYKKCYFVTWKAGLIHIVYNSFSSKGWFMSSTVTFDLWVILHSKGIGYLLYLARRISLP